MLSDISPSLFRQKYYFTSQTLIPLIFPLFCILYSVCRNFFEKFVYFDFDLRIFNTQFNCLTSDIDDTSIYNLLSRFKL